MLKTHVLWISSAFKAQFLKGFTCENFSRGKFIIIFKRKLVSELKMTFSDTLKFYLYCKANLFFRLYDFYPFHPICDKRIAGKHLLCFGVGFCFSSLQMIFVDIQFTVKLKQHLAQYLFNEEKNRHRWATERKPNLIRSLDEIIL